ncbi:MAG: BNR-repeat neuraminidase N-terminal domain-containing protein, partial [Bacteroidota bacterium]
DAEDYDISILPAPVNMVYANTTVTQITNNVNAGALRQEVLQVKVNTTGQLNAPNATQMVFTTLGTTNIANIANARLYYTGSSAVYSSLTQLGATIAVPPADPTNMTFSFTRAMLEGDNYFWIAYDVVGNAPAGNVIDAKMVSVTVGVTNYTINATPAGARPILASTNMALATVAVVQNSNPVALGSALNDVIRVEITTTGAINPITLSSLTFRTNGTTNVGDIQNARVFFTGDIPVFSAASQVGATLGVPPAINTDFIVTAATPINLVMGKNYFWLTYDVKPTAGCNPAQVDALCNNVALSTGNVVPSPSTPLGARTINCGTAYYSQGSLDMMNPSSWNTARNGSGTALANVSALAVASNSFYVQNGHSMTTSISDTISNLYLEPGSYVTASQFIFLNTLYIQSFATYEQTYSQTNATVGANYIGSFYIKKDGTWKHNNVGYLPGNAATQYFEPFSIQWFQGVGGGTFPGGTNWGSVIIDIASAPNLIINAASLSYIHGDLDIRRWGGATNYLYINMDNPFIVDGSLYMRGGWIKGVSGFNCTAGGCTCNADASGVAVTVAGDFIMTGGQWNDFSCGSNASTGMAMSVGGNVNITGGTIKMDTKLTSKLDLVPTTPASTWNQTGGTVTLGNTNIKSGKTITLLGSKIGDVGAGTALTVETGGKLMASNFPVTGGGNFTLQTGAHLGIGNSAGITASGASGNVQVSGTRSYNSGATYEYYEGLAQATGNFTTTTTSATYPATVANLIINKTSAATVVTLTSSTDVTTNLQLTNGLLRTSYTGATAPWVRIPSTATITPAGGSANSYVDGFIRRQGQTDFTFPTGNAGRFARIGVLAPSVSTEFEARYIATPFSNTTAMAAAPITILDHVSKKEHWVLNKTAVDAATTKVRLHWEDASFSGILKFDSLTVGRWNAAWENSNCYGACPGNWTTSTAERTYTGGASGTSAGTIQSNIVSTFGTFTFGSVGIQPLNPLPVNLLAFAAECSDKGEVEVTWTTASEVNNDFFTLERSKNGTVFDFVDRIEGGGTTPQISYYTFDDSGAFEGINYYRLSQTDYDGTTKTLGTVVAKCQSMAGEITSFYNQAGEIVFEAGSGISGTYDMRMFDAIGKMAVQTKIVFEKGAGRITVPVNHLEKGVYLIQLSNKSEGFTFKHALN